jgi:hypothetical protein
VIRARRKDIFPDQITQIIQSFENFKAESDEALISNADVFVRIPAFDTLAQHRSSRTNTILLGRKGDGKTAILRKMQYEIQSKSAENTENLFSWINMEDTYFAELINKFDQLAKKIINMNKSIPPAHIASTVWIKFLKLTSLQIFLNHADGNLKIQSVLSEMYNAKLDELRSLLSDEIGTSETFLRPSDIGLNFVSFLKNLISNIIVTDSYLARKIEAGRKKDDNSLDVLRDLGSDFDKWAVIASDLGVYVTLGLDRFDDFIDNLVSNDLEETRLIRRIFLHGLVSAVYKIDRSKHYSWLRVIASLPQDLVIDMNLREIASQRRMHFVEIEWSRADLAAILDKRINAVIPGFGFADFFPGQIQNRNPMVLKKELACDYVIRHSTRKPREVMAHAAMLFEAIRDKNRLLSSQEFSEVIADSNIEIVTNQVVPEWNSVLPNLRACMHSINRHEPKTVFSLNDFEGWDKALAHISVKEVGGQKLSPESRAMTALSSFFRIGIVGFRVRRPTRKKGYLQQGDSDFARYIFAYGTTTNPLGDIVEYILSPSLLERLKQGGISEHRTVLSGNREGTLDVSLCFSPMFFETLEAEHETPYIIDEIFGENSI